MANVRRGADDKVLRGGDGKVTRGEDCCCVDYIPCGEFDVELAGTEATVDLSAVVFGSLPPSCNCAALDTSYVLPQVTSSPDAAQYSDFGPFITGCTGGDRNMQISVDVSCVDDVVVIAVGIVGFNGSGGSRWGGGSQIEIDPSDFVLGTPYTIPSTFGVIGSQATCDPGAGPYDVVVTIN